MTSLLVRNHFSSFTMGKQKTTRKFATVKRVIGQRDARLKKNVLKNEAEDKKAKATGDGELIREMCVALKELW